MPNNLDKEFILYPTEEDVIVEKLSMDEHEYRDHSVLRYIKQQVDLFLNKNNEQRKT